MLAEPHLALARFYEARGDLGSAVDEYRTALSLLSEEEPSFYASTLEDYAGLLSRMRREEDSRMARDEAYRIRTKYAAEIEEGRRRHNITQDPAPRSLR